MKSKEQTPMVTINDHTAELINKMAKKFYSDEENVKRFKEWHLKTYGCLPNETQKVQRRVIRS